MSGPRKLPEGHGNGMCAVSYVLHGSTSRILSCGPDGKVIAREADKPDETIATTSGAPASPAQFTCLAPHPHGTSVVVGDDAHFVKVTPSCYVLKAWVVPVRQCGLRHAQCCFNPNS